MHTFSKIEHCYKNNELMEEERKTERESERIMLTSSSNELPAGHHKSVFASFKRSTCNICYMIDLFISFLN